MIWWLCVDGSGYSIWKFKVKASWWLGFGVRWIVYYTSREGHRLDNLLLVTAREATRGLFLSFNNFLSRVLDKLYGWCFHHTLSFPPNHSNTLSNQPYRSRHWMWGWDGLFFFLSFVCLHHIGEASGGGMAGPLKLL